MAEILSFPIEEVVHARHQILLDKLDEITQDWTSACNNDSEIFQNEVYVHEFPKNPHKDVSDTLWWALN